MDYSQGYYKCTHKYWLPSISSIIQTGIKNYAIEQNRIGDLWDISHNNNSFQNIPLNELIEKVNNANDFLNLELRKSGNIEWKNISNNDIIWLTPQEVIDNSNVIFNNNNYRIKFIIDNDSNASDVNITSSIHDYDISNGWIQFNHNGNIENNLFEVNNFKTSIKSIWMNNIMNINKFDISFIEQIQFYTFLNVKDISDEFVYIKNYIFDLSYCDYLKELNFKDLDYTYADIIKKLYIMPYNNDYEYNYITDKYLYNEALTGTFNTMPVFNYNLLAELSDTDIIFNTAYDIVRMKYYHGYDINDKKIEYFTQKKFKRNFDLSTITDINEMQIRNEYVPIPIHLLAPQSKTCYTNSNDIDNLKIQKILKERIADYLYYLYYLGFNKLNFINIETVIEDILNKNIKSEYDTIKKYFYKITEDQDLIDFSKNIHMISLHEASINDISSYNFQKIYLMQNYQNSRI